MCAVLECGAVVRVCGVVCHGVVQLLECGAVLECMCVLACIARVWCSGRVWCSANLGCRKDLATSPLLLGLTHSQQNPAAHSRTRQTPSAFDARRHRKRARQHKSGRTQQQLENIPERGRLVLELKSIIWRQGNPNTSDPLAMCEGLF